MNKNQKTDNILFAALSSLLILLYIGCIPPVNIVEKKIVLNSKPMSAVILQSPKTHITADYYPFTPNFNYHFNTESDWAYKPIDLAITNKSAKTTDSTNNTNTQVTTHPNASNIANTAAASLAGAVTAGILDGHLQKLRNESNTFASKSAKAFPNLDLNSDFAESLANTLINRGITTTTIKNTNEPFSRLSWPTQNIEGLNLPVANPFNMNIESDLLIQISSISRFEAAGPINSFKPRISLAIAIFDGKSKAFIGKMLIHLRNFNGVGEYPNYKILESNIETAIPILRSALLSLTPTVADSIVGSKEATK